MYEYKTLSIRGDFNGLQQSLDAEGRQGWEIVSTALTGLPGFAGQGSENRELLVLFKRPLTTKAIKALATPSSAPSVSGGHAGWVARVVTGLVLLASAVAMVVYGFFNQADRNGAGVVSPIPLGTDRPAD